MAFIHKIRQVQLIGPKIRKLRKQRKLTQTELASRIGIQQSDLSRMEKGEYRVSLDNLFKILGEFDVSIGEFFDEPAPGKGVAAKRAPQGQLIRDIDLLSPAARREVEAFVAFKRRHDDADDGEGGANMAHTTRLRLERKQVSH